MTDEPTVEGTERGDDYYHVRFRDPDEFDEIRTPDWAGNAAGSVVDGSEVRTGRESGDDDWELQSVLVPVDAVDDEDEATARARDIVDDIES
ncbi:hypothetical protein [Halomarina ordinaria]|uniref:Uncharacterized protein n=1 Tax=Halomarina ordinaria TaxID=3033939 RepID=A0ABD5UCJ8_9EURY|nr:hypothetical protein [Halomarina sp. PSRA2]